MKTTPGPECSICSHKKRADIERLLLSGVIYREISGKYGMSDSALERHKNGHMPALVQKALEAQAIEVVGRGKSIIEQVRELTDDMRGYVADVKSNDPRATIALWGQIAKTLELQAKLLGEIGPTTANMNAIQVNVDRRKPLPPWATAMLPALDPPGRAALETACQLVTTDSFEETDSEVDEFYRAWKSLREIS